MEVQINHRMPKGQRVMVDLGVYGEAEIFPLFDKVGVLEDTVAPTKLDGLEI